MLCQRIANWDFGVFFYLTRHQSNRLQSSIVLIQRFILPSLLYSIAMNTVRSLQSRPFSKLTLEEKLEVKRLGPDRPQLLTKSGLSSLRITKTWYSKQRWLTGCSHSGKFYCFPCLLYGDAQRESAWTQSGVNDWKHLAEKVKRHVKVSCHVESCLKLAFFGKTNIAEQLIKAYRDSIIQHNLEVEKNHHILSRIIDCITFCVRVSS